MQPSGSFYSSGSQRTICSHVSYVYFIKQSKRENKVVWAEVGGTRQRTATGLENEGEVKREGTGGSINSRSIIRSSFSEAYTSPVHCLPKDSQHIQMSLSAALVLCNAVLGRPQIHACVLCKNTTVV